MSFKIKWIENDILITSYGELTNSDLLDVNGRIYGDVRFEKMSYQICDYREITSISFKKDDVKVLASLEKNSSVWNKTIKIACVISNDNLMKNAILAYKKGMEETNWVVEIFENMEDAKKWVSD